MTNYEQENEMTYAIIGAAMEVHRELGPGYLESVYQEALELELDLKKIPFISQPRMQINYKEHVLKQFYIPDLLVFNTVPVELKSHSAALTDADMKQILNSLKCSGMKVGLIINFGRGSLDMKRVIM